MTLPLASARWPAPVATALVWALAAASLVFWGLRLTAPADRLAPAAVSGAPVAATDPAALARLLGATPSPAAAPVAAPGLASRLSLLGVVVDRSGQGAALLVVDGQPARPYRVGATVVDGQVLQSLDARSAAIGPAGGGEALRLAVPQRPLAPNPPRPPG